MAKPRLYRTLKRKTSFAPMSEEHLPYMWAAYKTGALNKLHPTFELELTKEELPEALNAYMVANDLVGMTYFAEHKGKMAAIGIGLFWQRGRVLQTENLIWFPWSSSRNVLETYINFLNQIRRMDHPETGMKYMVLEFAEEKDQKFFDHVSSYGVMRRVGTSHEVYPGAKSCIYETRSDK